MNRACYDVDCGLQLNAVMITNWTESQCQVQRYSKAM